MDDWALIRAYTDTQSQSAFAELVGRYVDFVYSAALRQVGNRHLAEDVTQGVFLILSQKSSELAKQKPGALAGWLFNVTRFTSANAIRAEKRRRKHEARGCAMTSEYTQDPPAADWNSISPHLDLALSHLGTLDRDALLMRYFSGKSHNDIARTLGISEDAARKRVTRAIEKLRQILGKKGVSLGAVGLAGLISAHGVQAAPAGLSVACGTIVIGTGGSVLAKGAITMMTLAKVKTVVAAVLAILFIAGTGGLIAQKLLAGPATPITPQPPPITLTAQPAADQSNLAGFVKSPTGEPIAGAQVLLATQKKVVDVYASTPSGAAAALSAEDGAFSFNAPQGPCQIVVRHQLGYAQLTREQLQASAQVILQPWSHVQGIAKIGSKPAAGAVIVLERYGESQNPYSNLIRFEQMTKADAKGYFHFDQVVPGDCWVARQVLPQGYAPIIEYVDAQSGKTMNVNLGGRGQPVIGRVTMPKDSVDQIDWKDRRNTSFNAGVMPWAIPFFAPRLETDPKSTWEERRQKYEAWSKTPAGRLSKTNYGTSFWINPDGTFRIDDVSEGYHCFFVSVYHEDKGSGYFDRVATTEMPLIIPDLTTQGGQTDQPLDMGTVILSPFPVLRTGQPAPSFSATRLDGTAVKLSDFAGKFVLLVPWSKLRQPSEEDAHFIKLAHDQDNKDGKLVILTVEFDADADSAKQLAKSSSLSDIAIHSIARFSRGPVADMLSRTPVIPMEYFQSPSLITLIDPAGKVVAKNLSGDNIEGAVYRAKFAR